MAERISQRSDFERVVQIVSDSGGRIVGRTKLQKITYLLEATGLGEGFSFQYRHYGPYSEDLTFAARSAKLLGAMREEEHQTSWGGSYSIYSVPNATSGTTVRTRVACLAAGADPIELELAATAAFLAAEGQKDPWGETAMRKPEKASPSRLKGAKDLYGMLRSIATPKRLPEIL